MATKTHRISVCSEKNRLQFRSAGCFVRFRRLTMRECGRVVTVLIIQGILRHCIDYARRDYTTTPANRRPCKFSEKEVLRRRWQIPPDYRAIPKSLHTAKVYACVRARLHWGACSVRVYCVRSNGFIAAKSVLVTPWHSMVNSESTVFSLHLKSTVHIHLISNIAR